MDGDSRIPAAEQAYQIIRSRIISGDLPSGGRLKERTLATELGLSRTPVREAINRLIHEGFVERGEGYSTRVADFPEDELDQIFEIRRRLECYAAGRAATLINDSQIARLDALTTRMEALTPPQSAEDYEEISIINAEFHRIIAEAAASPRLVAILQMAVDVGIVARTYHSYSEGDLIRSTRHHRELVDAFQAGAADWAESVMSSHVLAAAKSAARRAGKPGDTHGT
ncbi:GntR family transcriptional regulator [Cognatishimia sp. F0-27]|uniref:GntR family transcriptional regulator n=1 Tax=Cognatishimia sp. F0-27 TaxID=2816855 RepID=UPI001D0CD98E|nr:GntR family transcriptional regulator [Cognatishimia sp. F0-27]MCC1493477.1 GntR family transcriptional regulator [Cognatishimia sp. F0-27]